MKFLLFSLLMTYALSGFTQKESNDTITIIGVGDMMLGTTYPKNYLAPHDGKNLLLPVADYLRNANITFGNNEGTLFNGVGIPKSCSHPSRCYAFKSPEHYANYLKDAGFDLMSVANNHSGDFGPEARQKTIDVLKDASIASAGTVEQPTVIIERDGIKYGLACFAPNYGTQSITRYKEARRLVKHLDSLCDIVIVSFHGGAEGSKHEHVPKKDEIFMGENRGNVYQFARVVINAGADIVFGHGPHVTRAVDLYKNRFIIYSLGNFATYGRFTLQGPSSIAPMIKIFVDKKGKFLKGEIVAIKQEGEGGPVLDESRAVIKRIRYLTKKDIPKVKLHIAGNGIITHKIKPTHPTISHH